MNRLTSWIRQNKASRIVYVAIALLGFALIALKLLGFNASAWVAEKVGPPQEVLGVSITDYNFTPHYVEYELGKRSGGGITPDTTSGRGAACCYKPEYAGQPLIVRWSYYGGLYGETARDVWHYEATLNPPFPKNNKRQLLTVRFYPGGRVAVRYTDQPEATFNGTKLSPVLYGPGWVQAQGRPSPALLEIEKKLGETGHRDKLDIRPVPDIPMVADTVATSMVKE